LAGNHRKYRRFGIFTRLVLAENPGLTNARLLPMQGKVKNSFKIVDFGLRRSKIPSILHAYGKTIN
jgi:hypothetical protein